MTINPFGDISNYTKLSKLYEENKDKPWTEWLEYKSLFGKPGKQGIAGVLTVKGTDMTVAFKLSQQIDNLMEHEFTIMNCLNDMSSFCPHFCKSIGLLDCQRNPRTTTNGNPFRKQADVSYMIPDKMLIAENIHNSYKLSTYIKNVKAKEDVIYSTIKQILLATSMAQKKKRLSHYDLHSGNIMMRKCNKDVVFLYILDEKNQIAVPTLGHFPVIIDYGFSYAVGMEDRPLLPSMGHTQYGYTSDRCDQNVDCRIFLTTISDEVRDERPGAKSRKLRKIVKKAFASLPIDFDSGWFDVDDDEGPVSDLITEVTSRYSNKSIIFSEYENFCVDILQAMIILPLEPQDLGNPKRSFRAFLDEWMKIENLISNVYYNLFILKGIVEAARYVRPIYMDEKTSTEAVSKFKEMVQETLDSVAKFCNPTSLNYEKMLCSLYVFTTDMESIFYTELRDITEHRNGLYEKLPLKTPESFYAAIDTHIPTEYVYSEKTNVVVLDSIQEKTEIFSLTPADVELVNGSHQFVKGSVLYDIYNSA